MNSQERTMANMLLGIIEETEESDGLQYLCRNEKSIIKKALKFYLEANNERTD